MQMNRLQLAGYLGKDPETRSTQGGGHVTNFSLGTSEKWKDKAGQPKQKTEWHRVVAWDKTAEFVQKHLGKGTHVYLEGAVRTRER